MIKVVFYASVKIYWYFSLSDMEKFFMEKHLFKLQNRVLVRRFLEKYIRISIVCIKQ